MGKLAFDLDLPDDVEGCLKDKADIAGMPVSLYLAAELSRALTSRCRSGGDPFWTAERREGADRAAADAAAGRGEYSDSDEDFLASLEARIS